MAYFNKYNGNEGKLDAGLGLIYRLNLLWGKVDEAACSGSFDKWNILLDRILCNLLYKEDFEIVKDENQRVINVKLSENDQEIFDYLNFKVDIAFSNLKKIKNKSEYHEAKIKLYHALQMKDIGLRKFMFGLKLYLKQSSDNPANAMWGG